MREYQETNFSVILFTERTGKPAVLENNSINKLTFYEDIFSMVPLATLEFVDRAGLVEAGPITGRELVAIVYGPGSQTSPNEDSSLRHQMFVTYDIDFRSEIQTAGAGVTVVTMKLVNLLYITLNHGKYSKSWLNKKGSEIITDICTNMLGGGQPTEFVLFEQSEGYMGVKLDENNTALAFPYWTPGEMIKWLLNRMQSVTSPGYLFYCNTKGFNLVTLNTLLGGTPEDRAYFFTDTNRDTYFDENRILNWKMYPPSNQALTYLPGGIITSSKFEGKDQREDINVGSQEPDRYTQLGAKPLYNISNNVRSQVNLMGGDYTTLNVSFRDKWIKRYMKQLQFDLMLKGHVKRYAGMMIKIIWPAMKSGAQNHMYNGRYIVKSIQHIFTPGETPAYKQMVRVVKSSYEDTQAGGTL